MRIDEVAVDPVRARVRQLPDVQLTRCEHHLTELTVDHVPVNIRIGKHVVLPQRLQLRHGVMECTPVPETYVVEQRLIRTGSIGASNCPGCCTSFSRESSP